MHRIFIATAACFAALSLAPSAFADVVTANCTGMLNLDVYKIETDLPTQEVKGIGQAEVSMDDKEILLQGDFGTYRFDLKVGTLYHNDKDTGVYCTYSGLKP